MIGVVQSPLKRNILRFHETILRFGDCIPKVHRVLNCCRIYSISSIYRDYPCLSHYSQDCKKHLTAGCLDPDFCWSIKCWPLGFSSLEVRHAVMHLRKREWHPSWKEWTSVLASTLKLWHLLKVPGFVRLPRLTLRSWHLVIPWRKRTLWSFTISQRLRFSQGLFGAWDLNAIRQKLCSRKSTVTTADVGPGEPLQRLTNRCLSCLYAKPGGQPSPEGSQKKSLSAVQQGTLGSFMQKLINSTQLR